MIRPVGALLFAALAAPVLAQKDVAAVDVDSVVMLAHGGAYPDGVAAISSRTTICNVGTEDIPWLSAMNEDHPIIASLMAREQAGRFEQVSDRSYVKHAVNAFNSTVCGTCSLPGSQPVLAVGCSDTYSASINGNNYHLGPPEEVDPFLGTWVAACSHFDRGEPPVPPPFDCDGVRSLSNEQVNMMGPIGHRLQVLDADLEDPEASYFWQVHHVVRGEPEALRDDNLAWLELGPAWNGGNWSFPALGHVSTGSVLAAWSGATVSSATNGALDGRVFVGALATQVGHGWHYEYALHNRDHAGGVGAIRIPLAPGAAVTAAGTGDVDADPLNDWTHAMVGGELVFAGPTNPLAWNTIYNVWFDSDATPASGSVTLEPASPLADFAVAGLPVPAGALASSAVSYCTAGTSASGCTAVVASSGVASASAPSGHVLFASGVEGSKDGQFYYGTSGRQATPWGNGTSHRCVAPPTRRGGLLSGSGAVGTCEGAFGQDLNARWTALPGHNPGAGATVQAQFWYRDPQSTSNQTTSFSDALEFVTGP